MKWKFKRAASQFSLQISIKKTECLYQSPKLQLSTSLSENISISTEPLVKCKTFKYLESTVSENARLEDELSLRMGRASAVFGSVRDRLWNNRYVSIRVKCKVYRETVVATLLNGAETWTVYMMRHLQAIMNISWKDKISNKEVLKRAGLPSMEDMLIQMNLRWLGHVERMDHQGLPRQILYSQLCEGKCNLGRPRLTFKATVKRNLEKLDIERSSWQQEAKDRAA